MPMPRFIVTRCIAKTAGRFSRGASPASIDDWDGQKAPFPIPDDRRDEEPLPGGLDERVAGDPDREEDERDREHPLAADSIDQGAGDRPRDEADGRVRAEDEPGGAEADPALVVQVDEREREDQTVPDRVQEPADLEGLHRPGELRVQAPEVAPHRETVARVEFLLDPEVVYLNHGSYGACPAPVFARYQELQRELERNPSEFLGRRFDDLLAEARAALAGFVGARPEDLVFVPNATAGLNAVIRSLRLGPEDEVLTTRHEYGAVDAHLGVHGRDARLRRAGRARGRDRPEDEGGLGQPHHLADGARASGRGDLRRRARGRRALDRRRRARTRPAPARSRTARGRHLRGQLPQVALRAEGSRVPLGAAGAPAVDRAARDLVGLRRRGELRRAARLAGNARSGGVR